MKGLLVKDIRLMKNNKRILIILFLVALITLQSYDNYGFVIGYTTMMGMLFVFNTIAYDEYNKSIAFLMTMPVKRETYVSEKYFLLLAASLVGTILSTIASIIMYKESVPEILGGAVTIYTVMAFMQLLMLPIQLKFSGEKGRMVLITVLACFAIFITSIGKMVYQMTGSQEELPEVLTRTINRFLSLGVWAIGIIVFLVWLVCLAISLFVSRKIMLKKEF